MIIQSLKSHNSLRELVRVVNFDERQAIGAEVSEKNDIVPALPLELILQIFSYLHILDTWSLQLVGTRWRRVLSSERFIRASLSRWDTHDPSDSARSVQEIARHSISDRIRHMRAVRREGPFSVTILDDTGTGLQGPQPQLSQRRLDFKGHRIAYVSSQPGNGDTVIVRDLISGAASMLRGEARERIMSVVLTTTLVAFVTFEGCLYVTEFFDHMFLRKTSRIQLPSSRVRGCSGDRGTIALAMGGELHDTTYITDILLYDAESQRLKSLPVGSIYKKLAGNVRSLNSCVLLVDSDLEVIDVFTLMLDMGAVPGRSDGNKNLRIRHIRISLEGNWLCANSWDHPLPFDISVRSAHFTMAPPQPTGYKGLFRLEVGELPFMGSLPIRLKFDVFFEIQSATFMPTDSDNSEDLVAKIGEGAVDDMRRSRLSEKMPSTLHAQWKGHAMTQLGDGDSWLDYMSLMNETFLVNLQVNHQLTQRSRIQAFCFDENVQMHGARSTGLWKSGSAS